MQEEQDEIGNLVVVALKFVGVEIEDAQMDLTFGERDVLDTTLSRGPAVFLRQRRGDPDQILSRQGAAQRRGQTAPTSAHDAPSVWCAFELDRTAIGGDDHLSHDFPPFPAPHLRRSSSTC